MTPFQCRMARAALDWSRANLARRAGVGMETIYRFERGRPPHARTVMKIRSALEAEGLLFLYDKGVPVGVRFSSPPAIHGAPGGSQTSALRAAPLALK